MSDDQPSMSSMYQRFQAIRTAPESPDAPPSGPSFEAELIAILRRPVPAGQARDGYAQKERDIGDLFALLSVGDASALHKRLRSNSPEDELAVAFARLVDDRRARLLGFLADARRRAALSR